MLRALDPRGGEIELHSLWIAVDEIEDAMAAGVHSRDQVRPRNWTLWRNAGGEFSERPLAGQFGKVRHLPFPHELPQKLGIHAVDAENDELVLSLPPPVSEIAGGHGRDGDEQQSGE